MQQDLSIIIRKLCVFLLSGICLAFLMGLIFIDVHWLHNFVSETSLTEVTQEFILVAIALSFFISAYRQAEHRHARVLIGGFFLCMLIREMDFVFDMLRHGAWVWFALAVTLICALYALKELPATLRGLAHFFSHSSYGVMFSGLLCILVFSRLFGMQLLWHELLLDGYHRVVKNMVEEGCELFGYSLCLFATVGYLRTECHR
ncbi:hypothetical protein AB4J97_11175 [Serratia fonticola]|uniref:hypothetical protein n=1 Tax=Serratia fonticola TaxID=47917 RepID=UPI0034C653BC